jgi:hypothetical protein
VPRFQMANYSQRRLPVARRRKNFFKNREDNLMVDQELPGTLVP